MNFWNRFLYSFGAWTWLAELLGQVEFLQIQALNRYTYLTCVSRVQTRWLFPEKPLHALGFIQERHIWGRQQNALYLHNDNSKSEKWWPAEKIDFSCTTACITVGKSLITFVQRENQRM